MNYIYLNHIDLLKKFILYFKEIARPIINRAAHSKIIVPHKTINKEGEEFYNNDIIQEFLDNIKIEKVCIRTKGEDIYISSNEAKILSLIKCGYTAKEISKEIGLKQKTVEIYRDKLRDKLNQYTRGNLTTLANSNGLLDIDLLK